MAFDGEIGAYAGPLTGKEQIGCWPKPFSVVNPMFMSWINATQNYCVPWKGNISKGKPFSNHHFSRAILVFGAFKKQQFLKTTLANRNGTAKSLYARRQPLWVFVEMGFEGCYTTVANNFATQTWVVRFFRKSCFGNPTTAFIGWFENDRILW